MFCWSLVSASIFWTKHGNYTDHVVAFWFYCLQNYASLSFKITCRMTIFVVLNEALYLKGWKCIEIDITLGRQHRQRKIVNRMHFLGIFFFSEEGFATKQKRKEFRDPPHGVVVMGTSIIWIFEWDLKIIVCRSQLGEIIH